MPKPTLAGKLVVAISSRALFDLTERHRIYTEDGVEAYHRYQVECSRRSCCASIVPTSSTSR
jgi:5'-nucleotidase